MRRLHTSVAGMMGLVLAVGFELWLFGSARWPQEPWSREACLAALPSLHVLGLALALVISGLAGRGEVPFSRVAFLVVGGCTALAYLAVTRVAMGWYYAYINTTVGRWVGYYLDRSQQHAAQLAALKGRPLPPYHRFGPQSLLLCTVSVTVLLLAPAVLAGWLARGRRLARVPEPGRAGDRRAWLAGLAALGVAIVVGAEAAPGVLDVPLLTTRAGLVGAFPAAVVLAAGLAVAASHLGLRGEVALSGFTVLLTGGTLLLLHAVLNDLAPDLYRAYIEDTVGLWVREGKTVPEIALLGSAGASRVPGLLAVAAFTPPLLLPALLAGRTTRGASLRLSKAARA